MAIAKGIKKILKSVKSKQNKIRKKNELLDQQDLSKLAKPIPTSTDQMRKNISPALAGALGISVGASQAQAMKGGGVAGNFAKGVGKGAKAAARGLYRAKTGPLQVASAISSAIAPSSKLTAALNKAAKPFKKGGVASSKSKSSGVALKGFGKEVK